MFISVDGALLSYDGVALWFTLSVAIRLAEDMGGVVVDCVEYYI